MIARYDLKTIYEFGSTSEAISSVYPAALFLLPGIIGLLIYWYAKKYIDPESEEVDNNGYQKQFGILRQAIMLMVFSALVIPFILWYSVRSYNEKSTAYKARNFRVVEGKITHWRQYTTKPGGAVLIDFKVDTILFRDLETNIAAARKAAKQGKPLHNGQYVRISYLDNQTIVKLEME